MMTFEHMINTGKYDDLEEIVRDTLFMCVETTEGLYYYGNLSLVKFKGKQMMYEYDFDPVRFEKAIELSGDPMLPGFDPEYGWKQYHDKEISFVYERTLHTRRADLHERLAEWGIVTPIYSKWELLKVTKGIHFRDKWRCTADINETYI